MRYIGKERDGQIFAICPKCKEDVWFDCLDRRGIDEFIRDKEICGICKRKEKEGERKRDSKSTYH